MNEKPHSIRTPDGTMSVFSFQPERHPPWPAIIFYMDAPGVRPELFDMARRLCTVGYSVFLPDLYYRSTGYAPIDCTKLHLDGPDRAQMMKLYRSITTADVIRDTRPLISFIDEYSDVPHKHIGIVGYCMSGPFVLAAAAEFADHIVAAACMYGSELVTDKPDSPHLRIPEIKGEIYFGCGEKDRFTPPPLIKTLRDVLEQARSNYEIEIYPGADHAFAFPLRRAYDQVAAERHWERLFSLFRRRMMAVP